MRAALRNRIAALTAAVVALPLVLSPTPATAQATDVTVTYVETSRWETGYGGQLTIDNGSNAPVSDWTIEFRLPSGTEITTLWDATLTRSGSTHTITPPSWASPVPAGGSYSIGQRNTRRRRHHTGGLHPQRSPLLG